MNQADTAPRMKKQVLSGKARNQTFDTPHIEAHRNNQCNYLANLVSSTRVSVKNESGSHSSSTGMLVPRVMGQAVHHHRCTYGIVNQTSEAQRNFREPATNHQANSCTAARSSSAAAGNKSTSPFNRTQYSACGDSEGMYVHPYYQVRLSEGRVISMSTYK
jgi:hypothetical protein